MAIRKDLSARRDNRVAITKTDIGIKEAIRVSLDRIGGISHFIKPNESVFIKPNLTGDRDPSTGAVTNPDVLKALIEIVYEQGPSEVFLGDSPSWGFDSEKTDDVTGVRKVAEETGLILVSSESAGKPAQKPLRGADTALIHFLKESAAFRRFLKDRKGFSITEMELRGLLRCTLETPLGVLKQNLQYTKNLANDYNEEELLNFLEACGQILTEKER